MARSIVSYRNILLIMAVLFSSYCSATNSSIDLVGSTPCDEFIKSRFSISAEIKIDFIKWKLKLDSINAFVLNITYGESEPNTLGFKGGGQKQTISGTYLIIKSRHNRFKVIYQLKEQRFVREHFIC